MGDDANSDLMVLKLYNSERLLKRLGWRPCPTCNGHGQHANPDKLNCSACKGDGFVTKDAADKLLGAK